MTIVESFDPDSEEMIRASDLIDPVEDFPETVVVTYSRRILEVFLREHPHIEIATIYTAASVTPVYQFEIDSQRVGFYLSQIGGSTAAGHLEEVIAMGGRRFLFFGSCGALEDHIMDGHIAVPTAAWRDEGVSYHYLPPSDRVEIPTADRLATILTDLDVPFHRTIAWTTDAFYRETRNTVARRKSAGCGVVDMECASVAAVGLFRGVDCYQFLFGADSLASEEWDPRSLLSVPGEDHAAMLDVAIKIAARIE